MRYGKNRHSRLAVGSVKYAVDIKRLSIQPGIKSRSSHEIVQRHCQTEALFGRIERLDIEGADVPDWRILDLLNERRQVESFAVLPGLTQNRRQQDMLSASEWIGINTQERKKAGHSVANFVSEQIPAFQHRRRWHIERLQNRNR